jgi:hypothetical protein
MHEAAYGAGILEDRRAVVAAGEHVIQRVRVFGAWASRHLTIKYRKKRKNNGTYYLKEKGQATRW